MLKSSAWRSMLQLSVLLCLLLAACNLPNVAEPSTATPPPTSTQTLPTTTVKPVASATTFPLATQTPTKPPATATQPPSATPLERGVSGYVLYDPPKPEVRGVEYATGKVMFTFGVNTTEQIKFNQAQYVGDTFYYFSKKDKAIFALKKGSTQKLSFIPAQDWLYFRVSLDGSKIAWSFDVMGKDAPGSELWIANIDGSNAFKIMSKDPTNNPKWLVLRPHEWLPDGRLVFEDEPTGIGGYILFYGFAGLGVYDPGMSRWEYLVGANDTGAGGLCLKGISPGLKSVVTTCATKNGAQISLKNLADGKITNIPMLPAEQGQSGSPEYSPSGAWLAYGVARGTPDKEYGRVVVVSSSGGAPKEIMSASGGTLKPIAWVDEDRLLVERSAGNNNSIWQVKRDGTGQVKLADGTYLGIMR